MVSGQYFEIRISNFSLPSHLIIALHPIDSRHSALGLFYDFRLVNFIDYVERPLFGLVENSADILPYDSDADELDTTDE